MSKHRWVRWSLGGLAVAALAWGCEDAAQRITAAKPATSKFALVLASPPVVEPGFLTLCKDTPGPTDEVFKMQFTVTHPNGTVAGGAPFIKAGQCLRLGDGPDVSTQGMNSVFEPVGSMPAGWTLVSVTRMTGAGTDELSGNLVGTDNNPVTCAVTTTDGCVLIFHNTFSPPPPPNDTPCPGGSFTFQMSANGDLLIKYDQFPAPNDNSYGVNAVGWGSHGHKFGDLVGSDHAGFQLLDGGGTVRLSFNVDYITAVSSAPSGYASLGVNGGDGKMLIGTADGISATTSLANNLNNINIPGLFNASHVQQFGSVNLFIDSPPTDPAHQTYNNSDPALAGWDFHDTYYVTISAAKLAAIGFNPATWQVLPNADQLHNSPAKACPTDTGTGGCPFSVLKVEVKDRQVKVTIQNDGSTDAFLSDITLNWPSGVNGKLMKVKHDGDVMYDSPDIAGGTAHLTLADLVADQNKRKWGHTSSHVLTFEFEKNADTNLANYSGTVSFANCVLSLFGQ